MALLEDHFPVKNQKAPCKIAQSESRADTTNKRNIGWRSQSALSEGVYQLVYPSNPVRKTVAIWTRTVRNRQILRTHPWTT